jgi:hypothetical protein
VFQQHLPYLCGNKILVELTDMDGQMPKYAMFLCKGKQLGPIRRASQLHEPPGVKCGRGTLEEHGPFSPGRSQIG